MIAITNTKELHEAIQRLVSEPEELLRKNLKPWSEIPIEVRRQHAPHLGKKFDIREIWKDALNIPDHLHLIARSELERRENGEPPLKFVNY